MKEISSDQLIFDFESVEDLECRVKERWPGALLVLSPRLSPRVYTVIDASRGRRRGKAVLYRILGNGLTALEAWTNALGWKS